MKSAEFTFGRWYVYSAILGLPIWGLLILVAFYGGFLMLRNPVGLESVLFGIGGFAFGSWLAAVAYAQVRYFHGFRCRYGVTQDGVSIDDGGPPRFIPWSGFETAEYFPLLFMIRLRSNAELRPVALFVVKRGRSDPEREARNQLALQYIADGMGVLFAKRWTL